MKNLLVIVVALSFCSCAAIKENRKHNTVACPEWSNKKLAYKV